MYNHIYPIKRTCNIIKYSPPLFPLCHCVSTFYMVLGLFWSTHFSWLASTCSYPDPNTIPIKHSNTVTPPTCLKQVQSPPQMDTHIYNHLSSYVIKYHNVLPCIIMIHNVSPSYFIMYRFSSYIVVYNHISPYIFTY